jgi:hypothetical protein
MDNIKLRNTMIISFVCIILFLISFLIYFFLNKSPNKSNNNSPNKSTINTVEKTSQITFLRPNNGNGILSISQITIYDDVDNIIKPLKISSSNNKSTNEILNEMIMFEDINKSQPPKLNENKSDIINIKIPPSIIQKVTININEDINLNNIGNCFIIFKKQNARTNIIYHLSNIQTHYTQPIMTTHLQIYGNAEVFISKIFLSIMKILQFMLKTKMMRNSLVHVMGAD